MNFWSHKTLGSVVLPGALFLVAACVVFQGAFGFIPSAAVHFYFYSVFAAGALALSLCSSADAQVSQSVRAGSIVLKSSGGGTVTLEAPAGIASNLTWQTPIPPAGDPLCGA